MHIKHIGTNALVCISFGNLFCSSRRLCGRAVGKKRFCEATWMMRRGKDTMFTFDESFWSHDGYEDDGTGYLRKLGCALRTAVLYAE